MVVNKMVAKMKTCEKRLKSHCVVQRLANYISTAFKQKALKPLPNYLKFYFNT